MARAKRLSIEERINKENISKREKELLFDFKRNMEARAITENRVRKNLFHVITMLHLGLDIVKIEKKNIEEVLSKVEKSSWTAWTKHDIKANLKKYIAFRLDSSYNPQEWLWIKTRLKTKDRPLIAEGDILSPQEIEKMIESANSVRDKALLSVLYESAARPSEILTLRIKDIKVDKFGAIVNIQESKTIKRPVRIVNSVAYLVAWLNIHPLKDDAISPLWVAHQSERRMSLQALRIILLTATKKSGIRNGRRIYPYLLRHSRITHLLQNPKYSQAIVKRIVGWTDDSEQISTYLHMSNDTVDKAVLEAEGKINEKEEKIELNISKPKICHVVSCRAENPQSAKICYKCHSPLDLQKIVELDIEDRVSKEIANILLKRTGKESITSLLKEKQLEALIRSKT